MSKTWFGMAEMVARASGAKVLVRRGARPAAKLRSSPREQSEEG
jgi:hypothetical protein